MEGKSCLMCEDGCYSLVVDGSSSVSGELKTWWSNTLGCESQIGFSKTVKVYKCDQCGNLQIFNPEDVVER